MSKRINFKKPDRGVAALMVVSAFALLFIALVVGLSVVSLREQREAGDIDQTNRANAIAEQGIADAFSILDNDPSHREKTCTQKLDSNGNGWTCRTITATPGEPEGALDRDESDLIRVDKSEFEDTSKPVRYSTSMAVEYCSEADIRAGVDCKLTGANPFSTTTPYPTYPPILTAPAALELSFIYWTPSLTSPDPDGGNNEVSPADPIKVKTFLVSPTLDDQSPLHSPPKLKSKCSSTPTDSYYCKITYGGSDQIDIGAILGGPAQDFRTVVKVKARYNASHYKMTFENNKLPAGNQIVPVPATNYLIDVTAKAGNIYRRIIARRKIEQTVSEGVFDNALFAASNICKTMTVKNDLSLNTANSCG